jgi:hypothetical protein
MNDILLTAGVKIVYAEYVMPVFEKPLTKVRPQEPGPSGDCASCSKVHGFIPRLVCELSVSIKEQLLRHQPSTGPGNYTKLPRK